VQKAKRKKLQKRGFKVGSAQEFLGLSNEEMRLIDRKVRLGESPKRARRSGNLTQRAPHKLG
jgi:hypothetical protein